MADVVIYLGLQISPLRDPFQPTLRTNSTSASLVTQKQKLQTHDRDVTQSTSHVVDVEVMWAFPIVPYSFIYIIIHLLSIHDHRENVQTHKVTQKVAYDFYIQGNINYRML